MTEPTLQEKLRANKARSISQADATAKREKQQKIQQQQKLQKQKEENDVAYQKHQKDLAEYNQLILKLSNTLELMPSKQIQYNYHNSSHI